LIKLVLDEQGSDLALELWRSSARAASSLLAYPEGRAALAAARRQGRLDQPLYREAQKRFDRTYEELVAIGVDQQLAQTAGDLAEEFSLRGYDAVHLATALDLSEQDVALVSWDRDLSRAATAAGLAVLGE
jgi:predicted nucleic acid-binding protein